MRGRFEKTESGYRLVTDEGVELGEVVRDRRSTDTRIAGTRLRRPGKGAIVWCAEVPRAQWDHPRSQRTGERFTNQPKTAGQLARNYGGGYRLENRGQTWDTRAEAAQALIDWEAERCD